jgi:hypothetical protein
MKMYTPGIMASTGNNMRVHGGGSKFFIVPSVSSLGADFSPAAIVDADVNTNQMAEIKQKVIANHASTRVFGVKMIVCNGSNIGWRIVCDEVMIFVAIYVTVFCYNNT